MISSSYSLAAFASAPYLLLALLRQVLGVSGRVFSILLIKDTYKAGCGKAPEPSSLA